MIRSKPIQRLVGLLVLALGAGGTVWVWYTALSEGYYYRKTDIIFPFFAVIGLGFVLFPIDMDELRAEHGVEQIQHFRQLPPEWKVFALGAVAAGLGNWYALAQL
jgi:hypothetical protein